MQSYLIFALPEHELAPAERRVNYQTGFGGQGVHNDIPIARKSIAKSEATDSTSISTESSLKYEKAADTSIDSPSKDSPAKSLSIWDRANLQLQKLVADVKVATIKTFPSLFTDPHAKIADLQSSLADINKDLGDIDKAVNSAIESLKSSDTHLKGLKALAEDLKKAKGKETELNELQSKAEIYNKEHNITEGLSDYLNSAQAKKFFEGKTKLMLGRKLSKQGTIEYDTDLKRDFFLQSPADYFKKESELLSQSMQNISNEINQLSLNTNPIYKH